MKSIDVKSIIIGALVAALLLVLLDKTLKYDEPQSTADHIHPQFKNIRSKSDLHQMIEECNVYIVKLSQNAPSGYIEC